MEIKTDKTVEGEIVFPDASVGPVNLAVERLKERHGVFGHGMRRIGGNPHDPNPKRGGGFKVDLIKARAAQGDELDAFPREALEAGLVDLIVHKDTDSSATSDGGGVFCGEAKMVKDKSDSCPGGGL